MSYHRNLLVSFVTICISVGTAAAQNATVSVVDFGARTDGTNSVATTAAFQQAFAAASPSGKVIVPSGYYAINNPQGGFAINGFNGEVKFDGDSHVVFQSNSQSGFVFSGGWGARLNGAHLAYQSAPSVDLPGIAALAFNGAINVRLSDVIIENCQGYGIWFQNSLEPKVSNASIINTLDDGIRFENSRNSEVTNATVMGSGRTGLDFVTAPGQVDRNGATASNIIVNNSQRGIAVNGTSRATLTSFYIDSSTGSGVFCGSNGASALPDGVVFHGGIVSNSAGFGVEVGAVNSCSISNVQVLNPAMIGVSVSAPQGTVEIRNVRVNGNRAGDAFSIGNTAEVLVSESAAENSPGYGFVFYSVGRTVASGLTTFNVAAANPLHRAVWFENLGTLAASGLVVSDSQNSPTGYVVGAVGVNRGSIQNVASNIVSGSLVMQNYAGLSLGQVN